MRSTLVAFLIAIWVPAFASDDKVVHDCDYWRLGKDEAEKIKLLKACDVIINDKRFSKSDRAMAHAERASAASSASRSDDAIRDLDLSLALEPDNVDRRRDRAYLLHHKGEHGKAIEDFDKVLAAKPDADHATFFRGLSYLERGDDTRGFADMAKAISLNPNSAWYHYWRAKEYAKRKNTDAALADLEKSIALEEDEDAYLMRAELYTEKADTEKAIADLTRAADIKPEYTVPISNRALLYEQTKQYDLAFADYTKLLTLKPGDAYYRGRREALMEKLAREPAIGVGEPGPAPTTPLATPKEVESEPVPPAVKEDPSPPAAKEPPPKPPRIAGQGECRRFDPIANLTISVPCPE